MDDSKHLPGNPFNPSNELGENAKTEALMAVAFELRTANLLAYSHAPAMSAEKRKEILQRLGDWHLPPLGGEPAR